MKPLTLLLVLTATMVSAQEFDKENYYSKFFKQSSEQTTVIKIKSPLLLKAIGYYDTIQPYFDAGIRLKDNVDLYSRLNNYNPDYLGASLEGAKSSRTFTLGIRIKF